MPKNKKNAGSGIRIALLSVALLGSIGAAFHFVPRVRAGRPVASQPRASTSKSAYSSKSISLPLFFEPNQGQTSPQVKFLARGSGYGLFLTANEAVLELQRPASSHQRRELYANHNAGTSTPISRSATSAVISMRLDGANASSEVSGISPLPGKSNYFIGNDASKWRHDIPQFARVQYRAVYPGVDLIYYGNQGQLEYDFRVAPGADPNQIALSFSGASAHVAKDSVSGTSSNSGDLILSTQDGDVRFHAPRVYQPAIGSDSEKLVTGHFRQLADNKIGFVVGDYDHSRELVIDPVLSYSTYLGGSGNEGAVQVAIDSAGLIYVAGATTSAYLSFFPNAPNNPSNPPIQNTLNGTQNIFIAVINPTATPATQQLVYATYLGGNRSDTPAGIAVDSAFSIYVAGRTTSTTFPVTSSAFQTAPDPTAPAGATHGFLTKISNTSLNGSLLYTVTYSTYLSGNGVDNVTGLAIDPSCGKQSCNAYVTGDTTSTNSIETGFPATDGFPANANGYQLVSNSPGYQQFFASKINTTGSGAQSMLYSTYFGGGNPVGAVADGGGIAVDTVGNMYITGTTNMLPTPGPNGAPGFPLFAAQQSCLNDASAVSNCSSPTTMTDAFVAKINANQSGFGAVPLYSTYVGGSLNDSGNAIAVDASSNAYITGGTNSLDFTCNCTGGFQGSGGGEDAFIAKIGGLSGASYPLSYFTYLGGSGTDVGNAIAVDSQGFAHVAGFTNSAQLVGTTNPLQNCTSNGDALIASISTTASGLAPGDYLTCLGGTNGITNGTGIALDIYGAAYVVGNTSSTNFPVTSNAYQPNLAGGTDAFVSKIGAVSVLEVTASTTSPSPNPVNAGTQTAFTFNITNTNPSGTGDDPASQIVFNAVVSPTTGLSSTPTAKVTAGTGSGTGCGSIQPNGTIQCFIPNLAVNATASVEVDVTPSDLTTPVLSQVSVSGSASANGGPFVGLVSQTVPVVDFTVQASVSTPTVKAGNPAQIQVSFCPVNGENYSGTITPSDSISPSMVTATTPFFTPTSVTLSGSGCQSTTLTISTVSRPVTTGQFLKQRPFYAAWLPIGGLSLLGIGIGATRKRRGLLLGILFWVMAAGIVLQTACGSSSTSTNPTGGTLAGQYTVTIVGTAGTGASHTFPVTLTVQ